MTARQGRWRTLAGLLLVLAGMAALTSYSVTLYRLFCAATGANGTVQRVSADTASVAARTVLVRFDTHVAPGLPWAFAPAQPNVRVKLGEQALVFFTAENLGAAPLVGHATFNVAPEKAGLYFKKVQCFCFNEERLAPHARAEMPVQFFVDPALARDPDTADLREITLAYTFFRSRNPEPAADLARFAGAPPDTAAGRRLFAERCAACHAANRNGVGPALAGVGGRTAGRAPGFAYSPALAHAGFAWNAARLERWLADPQGLVPGAAMRVSVPEAAARRDLAAYLMQPQRPAS